MKHYRSLRGTLFDIERELRIRNSGADETISEAMVAETGTSSQKDESRKPETAEDQKKKMEATIAGLKAEGNVHYKNFEELFFQKRKEIKLDDKQKNLTDIVIRSHLQRAWEHLCDGFLDVLNKSNFDLEKEVFVKDEDEVVDDTNNAEEFLNILVKLGMQPLDAPGSRIFWSGMHAKREALKISKDGSNKSLALEGSDVGALLDQMTVFHNKSIRPEGGPIPFGIAGRAIWSLVSEQFAEGATDSIHIYLDQQLDTASVLWEEEFQKIRKKKKVKTIYIHLKREIMQKGEREWETFELAHLGANENLELKVFKAERNAQGERVRVIREDGTKPKGVLLSFLEEYVMKLFILAKAWELVGLSIGGKKAKLGEMEQEMKGRFNFGKPWDEIKNEIFKKSENKSMLWRHMARKARTVQMRMTNLIQTIAQTAKG